MKNSKRMKKNKKLLTTLILLVITSTMLISLVGCGGFNENSAKKDSQVVLNKFLKISVNKTVIAKANEMVEVRSFVNKNCKKYFTNEFITDTRKTLSTTSYANNIFFLNLDFGNETVQNVSFFNNYKISSPVVDIKNETVTYKLASISGEAPCAFVYIEMKIENGKWKINKTQNP